MDVKLLYYLLDTDALVDTTKGFKNHQPSVFDEIIQNGDQEKIIQQDVLALAQFLLRRIEIKINVKVLDKFCNRIAVGIRFLNKKEKLKP